LNSEYQFIVDVFVFIICYIYLDKQKQQTKKID